MLRTLLFYLLLVLIPLTSTRAIESLSIVADSTTLSNPISKAAIDDCIQLLGQTFSCPTAINNPLAEILLILPKIDNDEKTPITSWQDSIHLLKYPNHHYRWVSRRNAQQIHLNLHASCAQAVSFALYGLLQEQLWLAFYHPRQSYIPKLDYWPLTEQFEWSARPRFQKKGFHLHTMHPLELTEPLLNPACKQGPELVKEYIDWLARNQQNYFEFNLLETDSLEKWVAYISPLVDYAHSRGIMMGLDLSLHMTQQKAFKLYHKFPISLLSPKQQIKKNLAILFEADWDLIAMESSSTEFTKGDATQINELQLFITDLVSHQYKAKLAGREHVVRAEKMLGKATKKTSEPQLQQALDAKRGLFVHTVMFYGLKDKLAPVYENENLLHMLDILKKQQQHREVWYYPESAYWISFDNSVPMFLMPYLQTRLEDILLMDSLNVEGHLTFSSGWEWGYWLIDWSIARWSWEHQFNGKIIANRATQFLSDLLPQASLIKNLNELQKLQQDYIKDQQLIRYLVAQTVTDELPEPLNLELHPRPKQSYKWLSTKANKDDLLILEQQAIQPLEQFALESTPLIKNLKNEKKQVDESRIAILDELIIALKVTQLRAAHKAASLRLLSAKRRQKLDPKNTNTSAQLSEKCIKIREQAQALVTKQEKSYRYPLEWIAREQQGKGSTCYDFGYLYPVSTLHFWSREEQQILQNKFGPFFMSIWDVPRIIGIID